MKFDKKLEYAVILELFTVAVLIFLAFQLPDQTVQKYRIWEIFPALMAAAITTYGLKEMRRRT